MRLLTRSCFLLLLLGKLFLLALSFVLAISLPSLWSPPFPAHTPASIPLFLAKVRLSPTLTLYPPHNLVLWTDGSVPFPFGKGGSGILANCSLCGTEATLSFSAGPVCSSFFADVCAILHAPCWSRQHQQVCHFSSLLLLSESCHPVFFSIFPFSSNSVAALAGTVSTLFLFHQATMVLGHSFLPGNDAADKLARRGALLAPLQSLVVSLLLSLVSTFIFSRTGGVQSHLNFLTHRFLSISSEELVLPRHARCVLSRLRCKGHNLLLSPYLSRIVIIVNSSCSACGHLSQDTSHLILHCPATDFLRRSLFDDSLSLYDLWSRPWRVSRLLELHGLPPCFHPSEGVG